MTLVEDLNYGDLKYTDLPIIFLKLVQISINYKERYNKTSFFFNEYKNKLSHKFKTISK